MPNTSVSTDYTLYTTDNGLNWISNLSYVHPRNSVGNITLQESGSQNPILIIDPVKFNYTAESVINVIDTRFRFFEFPVTTIATDDDFTLDTNIEISDNSFNTKFTVPSVKDGNGQLTTYKRIGTSYTDTWFYNGEQEQRGFTRVPFATDNDEGSYEITPELIKYLKSQNKVIRFKIYLQVRSAWGDEYDIDPKGWNTSFRMILSRTEVYDAWTSWNGSQNQPVIYTEDSGRLGNDPNTKKPWAVPGRTDSNGNPIPMAGMFGENDYPGMYLEYIIDPNEESPGRKYFVQVEAGSPSWILSDACRWDIDIIDNPTAMPIYGNVYNIGNKNRLDTGNGFLIATNRNNIITYNNGEQYDRNLRRTKNLVTTVPTGKPTAGEYQQERDVIESEKAIADTRERAVELVTQILQDAADGSDVDAAALDELTNIDPKLALDTVTRSIKIRAALS